MKFVITEQVPCVQQWVYEVEASNETEAMELVLSGKAQMVDCTVEEHEYDQASYEIEDENGDVSDVEKVDDDLVELERGEMENDNTQDDDGFKTFNEAPYGQDDDDEDFLSSLMYGVDNKQ